MACIQTNGIVECMPMQLTIILVLLIFFIMILVLFLFNNNPPLKSRKAGLFILIVFSVVFFYV